MKLFTEGSNTSNDIRWNLFVTLDKHLEFLESLQKIKKGLPSASTLSYIFEQSMSLSVYNT